jgi:glycosyltransferase involved in cell wall biosynthesis
MKVLYVCGDRGIPLDGSKGASVHVRQTIAGLLGRGHELMVLAARAPARNDLGCPTLTPAVRPGLEPNQALHRPIPAAGDSVEAELEALALGWNLATAVELPPEVDVVYERYSLWSLTGMILAGRYAAPLVLEVNAPLIDEQRRYRNLCLASLAGTIERAVVREAAAVLCVSSPLQQRAAQLRGGADGTYLFANAVDTARFQPAAAPPGTGAAPTATERLNIVFVGSLKPWHGLPILLDAFARLAALFPQARLWIVGTGPERPSLGRQAAALGLGSRICFKGALPHEQVPALLSQADIAVAPYPELDRFYFSPLKLGEYLAAGLPVVTTQLGDLAALVQPEESTLLVPPGDPAAFAAALIRLAQDRPLRLRLGAAGRQIAERHLSLTSSLERLEGLLISLTRSAGGTAFSEVPCGLAMC